MPLVIFYLVCKSTPLASQWVKGPSEVKFCCHSMVICASSIVWPSTLRSYHRPPTVSHTVIICRHWIIIISLLSLRISLSSLSHCIVVFSFRLHSSIPNWQLSRSSVHSSLTTVYIFKVGVFLCWKYLICVVIKCINTHTHWCPWCF